MFDGTLSGAVIAGGKAERMQGKEKGLQLFQGKPMAFLVAEQLVKVSGSVVVNVNRQLEVYQAAGFSVVMDLPEYHDVGPLSGLLACLQCAKSDYLLIAPCDTPRITSSAFLALYNESIKCPDVIYFLVSETGKHPLHAILPVQSAKEALSAFLALDGKRGVMAFYDYHGCQSLNWQNESELMNVNYLDQLS